MYNFWRSTTFIIGPSPNYAYFLKLSLKFKFGIDIFSIYSKFCIETLKTQNIKVVPLNKIYDSAFGLTSKFCLDFELFKNGQNYTWEFSFFSFSYFVISLIW
jgi:hypothetical protein